MQSPASCAVNYGIADGPYCKTLANGTLDIGSPLKTALGNYDTTWTSKTKPGIGSGLDGIGDLQLLSTTNPISNVGDQYNGRLDGDVTRKDRLSFVIYWVPFSTKSINGANRAANQYNHQQINNAFTVLENHTFSPSLVNEARASASGWRWNEVDSNPQAPFGLPIDSFVGVGNGTQPRTSARPTRASSTSGHTRIRTSSPRLQAATTSRPARRLPTSNSCRKSSAMRVRRTPSTASGTS